jgi:hypothetical protein
MAFASTLKCGVEAWNSRFYFAGVVLVLALAACNSGANSAETYCVQGDCVTLAVPDSFGFNQPTVVTITVKTGQDWPNAYASLSWASTNALALEGPRGWYLSAKAGQSYTFTTTVRFVGPGFHMVAGALSVMPGAYMDTVLHVCVTEQGGVVWRPGGKTACDNVPPVVTITPGPRQATPMATIPSPLPTPVSPLGTPGGQ